MKIIPNKENNNTLKILKSLHRVFSNDNRYGLYKLEQNIRNFYKLPIINMSTKTILKWIKLICPILPVDVYYVNPRIHYLYRIRLLKTSSKNKLNLLDRWKVSDSWAAPALYTPYGRLNKPRQVFLYLSFEPKVALAEKGVAKGDIVSCSCFEVVEPFKLVDLELNESFKFIHHQNSAFKKHYKEAIKVLLIYQAFLKREFSRKGDNNVYKLTNIIGQDVYDPKQYTADGWFYPSVRVPFQSSKDDDICLDTDCAKRCLRLRKVYGMQIGENYSIISSKSIKIHRLE